jgi:hypothetical protein
MSIKQFNDFQDVSVLENDSDIMKLALLLPSESFQLKNIMAKVFLQGSFLNESLKLRLHSSENYNLILAESEPVNLDNAGINFLGWINFEFGRQEIASGLTYYLTAVSNGYTRNGDISYISFVHDWPIRFYSSTNIAYTGVPSAYPKALQIFGRQ